MLSERPDVDAVLQLLVGAVNAVDGKGEARLSFPITLWLEGAVVTGDLIGYRRYHRRFGDTLRHAADEAFGEEAALLFSDAFRSLPDGGEGDPDVLGQLRLHLDNARFVSGGAQLPPGGALVRCKLQAVSAWAWGKLDAPA